MNKYDIERVNEKARKYADWVKQQCGNTLPITNVVLDALENAYATGMFHAINGMWRKVTPKDYPAPYTEVLALGETGDVGLLQVILDKEHGNAPIWFPRVNCKITHWMPIPTPPTNTDKE